MTKKNESAEHKKKRVFSRVFGKGFQQICANEAKLGGGVKHVLFSPLPGEMIQFDEHISQMGG